MHLFCLFGMGGLSTLPYQFGMCSLEYIGLKKLGIKCGVCGQGVLSLEYVRAYRERLCS